MRKVVLGFGLVFGLATAALVASPVRDACAQSDADLAAAKKAYAEGKAFFEKEKYDKAVEKFKESYKLSKNPVLLFNIALTFERLKTNDMAIFYYKKFLSDAPEDNAQRPEAEKSLAALEAAPTEEPPPTKVEETPPTKVEETPPTKVEEEPPPPKKKVNKRNTCLVEDFQHEVVDEAPPNNPLDLSAFVNEEASCDVLLYYRGSGDDKFTTVLMKPRYNELVARIPATKMVGNAVQYYIEVKTGGGELVTRIGKATSPNVIYIDEAAKPRFYPDLDDGDGTDAAHDTAIHDEDDDPLHKKTRIADDEEPGGGRKIIEERHDTPGAKEGGFFTVGSKKFGYAKWGSTGLAGAGVALSLTFGLMASSWAGSLEAEASTSNSEDCAGGPPCRTFDDYRKGLQSTGKRYESMATVFGVVGVVGVGVAAYFWYEELVKGKKKGETPSSTVLAPAIGDDFIGGSASLRF